MGDVQRAIKSGDWILLKRRELLHFVHSIGVVGLTICGKSFSRMDARIPTNDDEYFLCKKCKTATGDTRLTQDATFEETLAWAKAHPEKCV